jgi:hypothetical protein
MKISNLNSKISIFFVLLIFNSPLLIFNCFAQHLEIHGIKDISTNSIANKAWGIGGAILLDQWVKKTTFNAHFDWATYRPKNNPVHPIYDRLSGGISVYYSVNISKKFTLQCGAEINYTQLRHSYIYGYQKIDTLQGKPQTVQQIGSFVGIGPHIGINYELTPRFGVKVSIIPTYLISVGSKSSAPTVKPEYSKGMWLFPIQLGITYKLFMSEP